MDPVPRGRFRGAVGICAGLLIMPIAHHYLPPVIDPEELREVLAVHGADPYVLPVRGVYYGPGDGIPPSRSPALLVREAVKQQRRPAPASPVVAEYAITYPGDPWTEEQREALRVALRTALWVEVAPGVFRLQQV